MAAALTKTRINHLLKTGAPSSIPDPLQIKWYSGFTHSVIRRSKQQLEIHAPRMVSGLRGESGLVRWYMRMVMTRPVSTKSITSALIYTAADLSSQTMITGESSDSEGYDLMRTLRMAGCGLVIMGPSLHYWFNFVSRIYPSRDLRSTLIKMCLGQTVYAPVINVMFFSGNAAMQGESRSEIVARLERDLLPAMVNGTIYWPVCDFFTFKFFPVHLQPLVSNSFSYLWTVYITYMASLTKVDTS